MERQPARSRPVLVVALISLSLAFGAVYTPADEPFICQEPSDPNESLLNPNYCLTPSPLASVNSIDTTEVLLIFVKLNPDNSNNGCTDNPNYPSYTWPISGDSALPSYANILLAPDTTVAFDPAVLSTFPYRGDVTHFYYDMSGGRQIVYGKPFEKTVRLKYSASTYDEWDGNPNDGDGQFYSNVEVLAAVDSVVNFADPKFDSNGDLWVDMPIILLYRWMAGNELGPSTAELFPRFGGAGPPGEGDSIRTCYATRDSVDGAPVRIDGRRGIAMDAEDFWRAVQTLEHEWGHLVLGDAYYGCDVELCSGRHLQNADGFDTMDSNNFPRSTIISGFHRYRAGWQSATLVTSNLANQQIRPFRAWNDLGDLYVVPVDSQVGSLSCPCPGQRPEYFLVENRQRASFWEDPVNFWGDPNHPKPCGAGLAPRNTLPGSGLVIYHVNEIRENGETTIPPTRDAGQLKYVTRVDVEAASGVYDATSTAAGFRVIQDQQPLPFGPGGWDRLNFSPAGGGPDSMGAWSWRHFWSSHDSTSNCFAPYTNPGTGEYRPKTGTLADSTNDSLSSIGIINIREDSALAQAMLADFVVDYPAWDHLHINTTWSGIVRLHSDLIIDPGDTLCILPGTTVVMTPWHDQFHKGTGNDANRIEIKVQGALIALGALNDSICFTSAYDASRLKTPWYAALSTPEPGQWTGIVVKAGGTVQLDYCDIGYASQGVQIKSGAANACYVKHSRVHDCEFEGLWVKSTQGLAITGNVVQQNSDGIYLEKSGGVVDTNIVRMNKFSLPPPLTGSAQGGTQLKIVGPSGLALALDVVGNFFGGDRTTVCTPGTAGDTCFVQKGIVVEEGSSTLADTLRFYSNSLKYIDQTGLELNLSESIGGNPSTRITVGGGDAADIRGNELVSVHCAYDFSEARNTTVAWTGAYLFDVGIRSSDGRPVFGKQLTSNPPTYQGGNNYFWNPAWTNPDSVFVKVTEEFVGTLYAQNCSWNARSHEDLLAEDGDLFLVASTPLPNQISLAPCDTVTNLSVPWGWWPNLKWGGYGGGHRGAQSPTLSIQKTTPNPFSVSARIALSMPDGEDDNGAIRIAIYDVTGRLVRVFQNPDRIGRMREVTWRGEDARGNQSAPGLYFARLEGSRGGSAIQRVQIVR